MGRQIWYVRQEFLPGENMFEWNGKDMAGNECPSGIFFIRVETGGQILNTKLMKAK